MALHFSNSFLIKINRRMGRVEDKKDEPFGVKFLNFNNIGKTAAGIGNKIA